MTFLVLATVFPSLFYIFNFWARYFADAPTRGYNLKRYDFTWLDYPGIALTSTILCVVLIVGLHYFLTKNKVGLSLRAVSENPDLAATIGVNTFRAHTVSWFISGALAALVGSIMTIYQGVGIAGPDGLIINIMAGAILGGVYNVYGAIIGGLFIVLTQDLLKDIFFIVFGLSIESWIRLLSLIFLWIAMMFFPNGFFGSTGLNVADVRNLINKIKNR